MVSHRPLFLHYFLVCLFLFGFAAEGISQCPGLESIISLKPGTYSGKSLLAAIEKSSAIRFSYSNQQLKELRAQVVPGPSSVQDLLATTFSKNGFQFECVGSNEVLIYQSSGNTMVQLTGFVFDEENLLPVMDAAVYAQQKGWVLCDADGFFSFRDLKLPDTLSVVMPGYQIQNVPVSAVARPLEIYLKPDTSLQEVRISGNDSLLLGRYKGGWMINTGRMGRFPTFSITPGVLNTLALLPGLQSAFEVNGGIVVRGGDLNQNLVLMDGLEVYNPTHSFGMFGVFSGNSLQGVELYKGSFPSRFSGRASSVMNMRSRQGNLKEWQGVFTANPLFGSIDFNGPLIKQKTGLNVSLRRSLTDMFPLYYGQIQEQNEIDRFRFYFFDMKVNLDHQLKSNGRIYLSTYAGGDVGYINKVERVSESLIEREENRDVFNQGNMLIHLGWKNWWKWHIFSNISAGITQYRFDLRTRYELDFKSDTLDYSRSTRFNYRTQIRDYQIHADFSRQDKWGNVWNAGSHYILHDFIPKRSSYLVSENGETTQEAQIFSGNTRAPEVRNYLEFNSTWRKLENQSGLTYTYFLNDKAFHILQPRLHFVYHFNPSVETHAGYGKTAQFLHAIPNNNTGLPFNVWVPGDKAIPPVLTEQFEVGLKLSGKVFSILADAYSRKLENVLTYKFNVVDLIADQYESVVTGNGRSKGIELLLTKTKGDLSGWIKYTLSKSERRFDEFNGGIWFPFQFDRRHDLAVVTNLQLNKSWKIGLSSVFSSGHYITIPESQYLLTIEGEPRLVSQFGDLNNLQVPDYYRLDIGVTYERNMQKFRHVFSANIYNITNRQNVYYVTATLSEKGNTVISPVSMLPIIPSLNYALHF